MRKERIGAFIKKASGRLGDGRGRVRRTRTKNERNSEEHFGQIVAPRFPP